jgi:hypothetical protein
MFWFCTKAVLGIEPREWYRTPQGGTKPPQNAESELREATYDELAEAGWRTQLVEKDGKYCIQKGSETTWCEN